MRFITLASVGLGLLCTNFAAAQEQRSIGQITAAFGEAQIVSSGSARRADVFSTFKNNECVKTKDAGLSLVLRTRLVVKLDAATCVRFSEGTGQTNLQLEDGTVQVFAGKRAAYMGDAGVQDALVRIDGKDAVFLASYDRAARSGYYACEHGTVTLESAADHKRFTLNADQQAIAAEGKAIEISALDRAAYNKHQRTLQRLGQSVIAQGSNTQRDRSNAFDTRNALAQLEAAGWIDRKTLVVIRPLANRTSDNSEPAKTTDNQIASSGGSSNSASATPSNSSHPPVLASTSGEPSEPSEQTSEVPPPRESTDGSLPEIEIDNIVDKHDREDNDNDSFTSAKPEKSDDLPRIKLPNAEKVDGGDDNHGVKLPKAEKVDSKQGKKDDLPDLKIPKVEKQKGGNDFEVKDLKEITKKTREKVEKSDKHGKKGKGEN